jgi:isoleucyl-tRNA synthetase
MPIDESGRFYPEFGWLAGQETTEARAAIIADLDSKGLLVESGEYLHSYPHCWRCDTPSSSGSPTTGTSPSTRSARSCVRPTGHRLDAPYMGKLMDDWLVNMGDWNISRRRYYGLPLPFYPCDQCGHLTVVGSKAELAELATAGMDQLEELHRPWIDRVTIRCSECGNEEVNRIAEVGDVWLDAGIVPMSTLGWQNPQWIPEGDTPPVRPPGSPEPTYPTIPTGRSGSPPTGLRRCVSRCGSGSTHSCSCRSPWSARPRSGRSSATRRMLAEDGREMHGSWGNLISAEEAFEKMGADVMRWLYCAHPPDRNLLFGYEGAHEVRRRLLTLWNSAKFLIDYGNIEGFQPVYTDLEPDLLTLI